jgi:hypothetical protein
MDIATLTTLGGVVTSVASSIAAALAWGTKLQFSEEFKEARNAQVTAANQVVESIKVQRDAEIQQIRIEVEKKNLEIDRLQAKIEDLERNTNRAFQTKFEELKAAYESMIASFQALPNSNINNPENKDLNSKKIDFENRLDELGKEISLMSRIGQVKIDNRKEARAWLKSHSKELAEQAFDYIFTRYPNSITTAEDAQRKEKLNEFYWDLEEYLETICDCIVVDRPTLIDRQNPSLPASDAYKRAFMFIKKQVSGDISDDAAAEIKKYITYLIASFG